MLSMRAHVRVRAMAGSRTVLVRSERANWELFSALTSHCRLPIKVREQVIVLLLNVDVFGALRGK